MKAYLGKYPPSWDGQVNYDPTRLALKVLDEAIPILQQNREGPLEYLRYSFRYYPFDEAFDRVRFILPDGDKIARFHHDSIDRINTEWSQTPVDKIQLADYKTTGGNRQNNRSPRAY
jgi:hypothetical protein